MNFQIGFYPLPAHLSLHRKWVVEGGCDILRVAIVDYIN
jgi:hypothetical protein